MGRFNWYVAVVIALVFTGRVWAQPQEGYPRIDTPGLSLRQADTKFTPPPNAIIHDAVFAPDGKSIYLLISDQAVDLWALVIFYWPEEFCLLLGITFWFLGRMIWLRLVGGDDQQEKIKKHLPSAYIIHVAVVLGAVGTYIILALVQPPRVGSVSQWFDWDSQTLADWAIDNNQEWLIDNLDVMEPLLALEEIEFPNGQHLKQHKVWRRLSTNRQDAESEWIWHQFGKQSKWKGGQQSYMIESDNTSMLAFYQLDQLHLFDCQRQQVVKIYQTHLPSWCRLIDINTAYGIDGDAQMKFIELRTGGIFRVKYDLTTQSELQYDGETVAVMNTDRAGKRFGPAVLTGHPDPTQLASTMDGRYVYAKVKGAMSPKSPTQEILVWDTIASQWIMRLSGLNSGGFRMTARKDGHGLLVLSSFGTAMKIYDLSDKVVAIP
jgi:hypothetical protein